MKPLVSIITPTHNSSKFIEETIISIQKQTIDSFELIIIDDFSSDNTKEIVEKFTKTDKRINFICLSKNSGAAVARNTGIKIAKGRYLTFIDGDDLWMENFLEISIKAILDNDVPFVFASYMRKDEELKPLLSDFIVPDMVTYHDILKSCPISCLTAFIDIQKLGKKYMPLTRKRQDFGLWLAYLKDIEFAKGIKEPLGIYRIRKNSLSRNKMELIKYQWYFYYKHEKLNFFKSSYYLINWAVRGFLKYNL